MQKLNEKVLTESVVLDWLKNMGYEVAFGPDISPGASFQERGDYGDVVLETRLQRAVKRINPDITDNKLDEVIRLIKNYTNQDLELGNKEIYEYLTKGVPIQIRDKQGEDRGNRVKLIDFDNIQNNEFLVVNQFSIQGRENRVRIPDIIVFINGIPIAVFELKSPTKENATIADAFSQIHDKYKRDIPKLFLYNQILVVSDLFKARHGTISSSWDFFTPWKGIESENEKIGKRTELEMLTKGIFDQNRLVDIINNFIIFEADAVDDVSKYIKKMCMYHQYYGVNRAVENTLKAVNDNKKIGVFWHTQGSGKSISMVFYVNKVKKLPELNGPTILFLTDRNDLDKQLFKTFLRSGYPTAKQADSIKGLISKIRGSGAEVLFTTLQKFNFEEELNNRRNFIVIADEAHRSQYAKFAGNLRKALPNSSFMGITGTPIELNNKNTRLVFGNSISEYPIDKSVEDGTTVPIYYEGRLAPLHLMNKFIDMDFDKLTQEHTEETKEVIKRKIIKIEQAIGSKDRLSKVANDIVFHFKNRGLEGKAMIVTMSRRIAAEVYQLLNENKDFPETAVVISNNIEFREKIQDELDNKELEKRFKNPQDPLSIAIVCDMWLTGFDVPHLHTMYLDKPLKGHTLMQAIARVNRRYKDKQGGLIVDYIGVADNLKKALAIYTSDIQKQALIPIEEIISQMLDKYEKVKSFFIGIDYKNWKKLDSLELNELFVKSVNLIVSDPVQKKDYIKHSIHLYKLFSLVMPHPEANNIRDDIEFFEGVRRAIIKITIDTVPLYIDKKTESAVRDLINTNIVAEGVVDIYALHGRKKPEISILDEKFLEEAKKSKYKNLTIEALKKLLKDELNIKLRLNIFRYRSILEKLEKIIEDYENNLVSSTKIIEKLVELAKEIRQSENVAEDMGLSEEELAFYDALSQGKKGLKNGKLKELVKELVRVITRDIAIDWTNHEIIKARVMSDVRLVLLRHNVKYEEVDILVKKVYEQAENLYRDYGYYIKKGINN